MFRFPLAGRRLSADLFPNMASRHTKCFRSGLYIVEGENPVCDHYNQNNSRNEMPAIGPDSEQGYGIAST